MTATVVSLSDVRAADLPTVGGKAANLGEMVAAGLPVPPAFCVTTAAFEAFLDGDDDEIDALFDRLDALAADDVAGARELGAALRNRLATRSVPAEIAGAVVAAWETMGDAPVAVRSSATAEDLPEASFAGQHDTYLNVVGADELVDRTRACWISLYADRAILYRMQLGIAHRQVALSVIVQQMVLPDRSGILFTADPLTGNRTITTIDAGFGLGEALVAGLVSADLYRVDTRTSAVDATIGDKELVIEPIEGGGTRRVALSPERRAARVLTDEQAVALAALGARIAELRGGPQDIEWCIDDGAIFITQARPITSLYPALPAPEDDTLHVYFCFNHFQVMTDAMPPLACSFWRHFLPFGRPRGAVGPNPYMVEAGGRMFVDVSRVVRFGPARHILVTALTRGIDALAGAALKQVAERPEFRRGPRIGLSTLAPFFLPKIALLWKTLLFSRLDRVLAHETALCDAMVARAGARIEGAGNLPARLHEARAVVSTEILPMFRLPPVVLAGIAAGRILQRLVPHGPGIEALGRGLEGNVTTDMDLAVGDLADVARPHAELAELLRCDGVEREAIAKAPGGQAFLVALDEFLERYGCRAPSEIDASRPRWREDPSSIIKAVAGNLAHSEAGAHRAHVAALATEAERVGEEYVRMAGFGRGWLARRLVGVQRAVLAIREHPKFVLVRLIDIVRSLALEAGSNMDEPADVWLLSFEELIAYAETGAVPDLALRRERFVRHRAIYPPRLVTSDGESPVVQHDANDLPLGALAGSAASSGVVDGIARVIRDPMREVLHEGEILVAPFTDPGWTPLFLNAAGLVMEVGGLMTHGSVVAREYGIPAVVCVPDATTRILTGQRVRVNGDGGFVEILAEETSS